MTIEVALTFLSFLFCFCYAGTSHKQHIHPNKNKLSELFLKILQAQEAKTEKKVGSYQMFYAQTGNARVKAGLHSTIYRPDLTQAKLHAAIRRADFLCLGYLDCKHGNRPDF